MKDVQESRPYRGRLRQEQVERTRDRILEGLLRTMARGVADLSVPAVAREAGVSVPTVYRYFHTKRVLVEALPGYIARRVGAGELLPPTDPEDLSAIVRQLYARSTGVDATLLAGGASPLANDIRRQLLPMRLKLIEEALAPVAGHLNPADRDRLRNVVLVLASSVTMRAFADYLDLSPEEAADHIAWTIRMLTRAVARPAKMETYGQIPHG